jgi:hypothetical protein
VAMFWAIETSTMAPIENLTMEKNKRNLGMWNKMWMNIPETNLLTLSDVETPMMENFKHAYVFKT